MPHHYTKIAVYDEWKKNARPLSGLAKQVARDTSPYTRRLVRRVRRDGYELQYRQSAADGNHMYVYKLKDYHVHPEFVRSVVAK